MKILLVAINAKYIHSNPAVHSLRAYAGRPIEIAEYTINQPMQRIMADICGRKPELLFFSCYIWNIRYVEELVCDLAKVMPDVDIWMGGPEVSFDAKEALHRLPAVKGILRGEGEESFRSILEVYGCAEGDSGLSGIRGITFRSIDRIVSTPDAAPLQLDDLPFFYTSGDPRDASAPLQNFENRIVYYESSRGCPFRCSYCLSSVEKSLRFKSLDRVKRELLFFLEQKVPQVKLIDRTFNCDHQRASEIWKFLREHDNGITNFHFEIAGDLLTDAEIEILADMRPGQIQLEIGVQTTNRDTLQEIGRSTDFDKLAAAVKTLRARNNVHLHLDLIAGLPYEDMDSFARSFNDVFRLRPHQLQLGFLKVLKGSPMERRRDAYGLKHTEAPPYEVLETKWISYEELTRLKRIEEMVEVYYNSGGFRRSLEVLIPHFDGAFQLFDRLAAWYRARGLEMLNLSRNDRYEHLLAFGQERCRMDERLMGARLMDALILDYYSRDNVKTRPAFFGNETVEKSFVKAFYSVEARTHRYLTGEPLASTDDPRRLRRYTHLEKIKDLYWLFDYTRRDPVTRDAFIMRVKQEENRRSIPGN